MPVSACFSARQLMFGGFGGGFGGGRYGGDDRPRYYRDDRPRYFYGDDRPRRGYWGGGGWWG